MSSFVWQIRAMQRADLSAVVTLEQACELSSWGLADYEQELANAAALLLVAASTQQLVGFFSGRVLADEFELFSLAVAPTFRRQGIGRKLLEAGLMILHERNIDRCFLEVRAANETAQNLYRECGFTTIGRRRGYYCEPVDDAVLMARSAIPLTSPLD